MNDEIQTPCKTGDPEHWFISRNGRQYGDDALLPPEALAIVREAADDEGIDTAHADRLYEETVAMLETAELKARAMLRRHAKDACFTQCPVRLWCLDKAMREGHEHGTWGGYYEEELDKMRAELNRRRQLRVTEQPD